MRGDPMGDFIVLKGIRFFGYHGVLEEERKLGGVYEVNLRIGIDLNKRIFEDKLDSTVDYRDIYDTVLKIGKGEKFKLLESLGHKIADEIIRKFPIKSVTVEVKKLKPPLESLDYVAIEITKEK
jgi:dihydroneopterin aldolase